ncbi:hypothetical protein [Shimia biformata]|uniref:hypothetical protein n=1 Tax=Shimia biformata TaxID=1294299 RepID=UPI001951F6AB|nr:hypothetical protein [Shimia biformata]
MKKPEFQSHGGKGLKFPIVGDGEKDWVLISKELLDDEVGDNSSDEERQAWVEANIDQILQAYKSKLAGGVLRKPFDRINVRRDS